MTKKELNLRQRRCLELLKDYDLVIDYHPRKTNVTADALSQKSLFTLRAMNAHLALESDGFAVAELKTRPLFLQWILPVTLRNKDSIKVIVDKSTKLAHFIPDRTDYSLEKLAKLYVSNIVRLHGVPLSIIPDRDLRFTSRFLGKIHEDLGTKLSFSAAYHPQIDGQSDYQSSIKVASFKALYGRKCRTAFYWLELSESKLVGTDLI
ncbi:Transposon Ty3-I Gag-Pol polyprotein [Gossypium australe]|uniref:Transposon Ty3-I Gag-Pol polyprotein n=1 Tax=Gossypium australe TaxID=47621 RepID=A0A5B6WMT4_9ROSI|nr:Transposon Ty3-I Gag-Pol polyprotein [Gossypium australe]